MAVEYSLEFSILEAGDDLSGFSCRNAVFTRYLTERAGQDLRRRAATVVLMRRSGEAAVIGYYTISAFGIALADLNPTMQKRLPRYPVVPSVLIGRLAVDERYEGKGLGRILLVDALERAARLDVAVWGVVVDAIDEAAARFYQKFGFIGVASDPNRLVLPLQTYLKARESR